MRKVPCHLLSRSPHPNEFSGAVFLRRQAFFFSFFVQISNKQKPIWQGSPVGDDVHPAYPPGTNNAAKTTASVFSGGRGEGGSGALAKPRELIPNTCFPTQGPSLSCGSGFALLPHSCLGPERPPRALTSPEFLGPGSPESSILKTT